MPTTDPIQEGWLRHGLKKRSEILPGNSVCVCVGGGDIIHEPKTLYVSLKNKLLHATVDRAVFFNLWCGQI